MTRLRRTIYAVPLPNETCLLFASSRLGVSLLPVRNAKSLCFCKNLTDAGSVAGRT